MMLCPFSKMENDRHNTARGNFVIVIILIEPQSSFFIAAKSLYPNYLCTFPIEPLA